MIGLQKVIHYYGRQWEVSLTIPVIKRDLDEKTVEISCFSSECHVFKNTILREFKTKDVDVSEIYNYLLENYANAAPLLTSLYKLCITCGYASARVECLFSAMSYVDAPRRRCSTAWRECALIHLLFEKENVRKITFDEFSQEWLKKPRSFYFELVLLLSYQM